jgi:queuosine precursor transporter
MTRSLIPGILAMAAIVVASNILVQHLVGQWLTLGAFTYPFAFLVTDLTNRLQGAAAARKVVIAGFIVGVICSLIGSQITGEFGLAFLAAQLVDITVFNRLRSQGWWRAPFVSTLIGASLDTAIFFSVAFSASLSFIEPGNDVTWATGLLPVLGVGPIAPLWMSLATADWLVKLSLAVVALIPFRVIVTNFTKRST